MTNLKRFFIIFIAALLSLTCVSCGVGSLTTQRWYNDDINKTVRTVSTYGKDGKLTIQYLLINPDRASRVGLSDIENMSETKYYKDLGKYHADASNAPQDPKDKYAMRVYSSLADFKSNKNESLIFYHIDKEGLHMNGNVSLRVDKKLGKEIDKKIKEHDEKFK
ncbi:MAG: hypothetical protein Q8873_00880 [Bacillota bacterium]|nr:hypothetical protein [Bacillota bacterium]